MDSRGATVLVCDDHPANIVALREVLEPLQVRLLEARSGREALRHLLGDDQVALILLDVQMPGLDGIETAKLIREHPRHTTTPIIFVTAHHASQQAVMDAYAIGAVDYLLKPIRPEILRYKVSVFADLYRARRVERANAALVARNEALEASNRELEDFAGAVAHDLREPLRGIKGYARLLADSLSDEPPEGTAEALAAIEECVSRMSDLVEGLLAYARVASHAELTRASSCDVALDIALANLAEAIASSNAQITRDPLPTVRVAPTALTQLFQNLVGNAIKFSGDRVPQVHVSAQMVDGDWVISVADRGIGIAPEHAERIFDMFQRLHRREVYGGTGMGLAICKKIAERNGGRIWVESEPEVGATFLVRLHGVSPDPDAQ